MKVLFTVGNYFPVINGVQIVVQYLAEGLAKEQNYDVHVATVYHEGLQVEEELNQVKIHRFKIGSNLFKMPLGEPKTYIDFILAGQFDVVIFECTQSIMTDLFFPYLKKFPGKKILQSHGFSGLCMKPFQVLSSVKSTVGNTWNYFYWKNYYKNTFPKYVKDYNHILCLSMVDDDYSYLQKFNTPVSILPNAADDIFFEPFCLFNLEKYVEDPVGEYAVSVANYSDVKNQIGILEEFFRTEASQKMELIFIGTEKNEYYDRLLKTYDLLKQKFGERKVHFLTGVDRNDIPGIMRNAAIYLVGSKREAFSISIIEAMSSGTPFISTNVGNASVLPGGIVIKEFHQMHIQIDRLYRDEVLRKELGSLGREYAYANCKIDQIVNNLKLMIESQ